MKKIYYIFMLVLISLSFNSCLMEDDDIFPESSSERISKSMQKTNDILKGAKNGWVMHYYSDELRMYGSFTVLASFGNNDSVTVASEIAKDPSLKVSSLYTLLQSAGPVLSFNTHNLLMHYFSDPSSSLSGLGKDGEGMGGDYEFLILEADESHVLLKGKKSQNKILMTPLPENVSWESYFATINNVASKVVNPKYILTINGKEYNVTSSSSRNMYITIDPEENDTRMAYAITEKGLLLYEPMTIDGVEFQNLTLSDDEKSLSNEDGSAVLSIIDISVGKMFKETKSFWVFDFNIIDGAFANMSDSFSDLLKQTDLNLQKDRPGSRFLLGGFGANPTYPKYDSNPYSMNFLLNIGTDNYQAVMGYDLEIPDGVKNEVSFTSLEPGLNMAYLPAFVPLAQSIADASPYIISVDNLFTPTYYKFVSKADPDFWFVAFKN